MKPGDKVLARKDNGRSIPPETKGEVVNAPSFGTRPDPNYVWVKFEKLGLRCMRKEELVYAPFSGVFSGSAVITGGGGGGGSGQGSSGAYGTGGGGAPKPTPDPDIYSGMQFATATHHFHRRPGGVWTFDKVVTEGFDQQAQRTNAQVFNEAWVSRGQQIANEMARNASNTLLEVMGRALDFPPATGKTVKFTRRPLPNYPDAIAAADAIINPPHIQESEDEQ